MPALSSIALGGMALGGIAGAVKGAQGTPDVTSTQTKSLAPMTEEQRQLQQQSLDQYAKQLEMANTYEQGINNAQGIQNQAQTGVQSILNGQAMQMTPQEQQNIMAIRNAQISQGSADINKLLDQRLQGLNASAASRGVRGQALSQLQGDSLRAGAEQFGQIQRTADLQAAQSAMSAPYTRIAAQQPFLTQGMSFADQMRLQAMQNRQVTQSPFMLDFLNKQRDQTSTSNTPGQEGDFWSGLSGGIAGAGQAANVVGGAAKAWDQFNNPAAYRPKQG